MKPRQPWLPLLARCASVGSTDTTLYRRTAKRAHRAPRRVPAIRHNHRSRPKPNRRRLTSRPMRSASIKRLASQSRPSGHSHRNEKPTLFRASRLGWVGSDSLLWAPSLASILLPFERLFQGTTSNLRGPAPHQHRYGYRLIIAGPIRYTGVALATR